MPLQWPNQFWQSLEEGAGKRCSECGGQRAVRARRAACTSSHRVSLGTGIHQNASVSKCIRVSKYHARFTIACALRRMALECGMVSLENRNV